LVSWLGVSAIAIKPLRRAKLGRSGGVALKDGRLSGNEILSALGRRLLPALIGRDNCMASISWLILISQWRSRKTGRTAIKATPRNFFFLAPCTVEEASRDAGKRYSDTV